ncbi:MAG: tetratricopeptide repeat-containing sensor histidine kinase [Saprospiraceae bacterium]|nr:tetratricopeptide repeat-containing sensor histidine kinase [Saprospiraceae bacterium]
MKRICTIYTLFLGFTYSLYAQIPTPTDPILASIDSLTRLFEAATSDTAKLAVLSKSQPVRFIKQPDAALNLYQRALTIAHRSGGKVAYSLMYDIGYLYQNGKFDEYEAFNWYQKALTAAEAAQDFDMCASICRDIGFIYERQDIKDKMFAYFEKGAYYNDKRANPDIFSQISLLYFYSTYGRLDDALILGDKLVALEQKKQFSSYDILQIYGYQLTALKQTPEKKATFEAYKNKIRAIIDTVAFDTNDGATLVNVAFLCLDINRPDLVIKYCNHVFSLPNYTKPAEVYALQYLAQAYEMQGNYPLSTQYYKKYIAAELELTKTTLTDRAGQKILRIEAEKDLLIKQNEVDKQKTFAILGLIIGVLLLIGVVLTYRFYKRERRTKQELADLNATKDRLFALLSHDLMSPMANFKNILMLTDWGLLSQTEFKDIVKDLSAKAHNLHSMFENVLHWAISQMQGIKAKRESVQIADIINEQIELLKPIADSKHIEIQQLIPNDLTIELDKNHLALIIRNLLQNALKFTNAHGTIAFNAQKHTNSQSPITNPQTTDPKDSFVHRTPLERERRYLIEIKDNGVGMSADVLDKLFKTNENTNRKGTHQEAGTGLGLILTKELVELNKGQISVQSEVGKGTTFSLTF